MSASPCILESMLDSCIFLTPQSLTMSKCVLVFVYIAIAVLLFLQQKNGMLYLANMFFPIDSNVFLF